MRIFFALGLLALTACQTTDIRQAYVDPDANIGAADQSKDLGSPPAKSQPRDPEAPMTSHGDLNSVSWVEVRMTERPRPSAPTATGPRVAKSTARPLTLLAAPGDLMDPAEFPHRFLAKP